MTNQIRMKDFLREPLIESTVATATVATEQPPMPYMYSNLAVVDSAVVIDLDVEAGQERKDLESRRAAKEGLVTLSIGLGFIVGVLM